MRLVARVGFDLQLLPTELPVALHIVSYLC